MKVWKPFEKCLYLSTERQRKKVAENSMFSLLLKVEIRIKTKNGIEYIIKQKHGKANRGKKDPTNHWSQSA